MGSLQKQAVVGVVAIQIQLQGWGGGLSKKQTVVRVVGVVAIRFNFKGGGGISLKNKW